jgi:sec-independent protein translocase protein TatC
MAPTLRPIGHDDRLSIVEHLDELRSRLIICAIALLVVFGLCFWQNQRLLKVLNRALPHTSSTEVQRGLAAVPNENAQLRQAFSTIASGAATAAASPGLSAQARQGISQMERGAKEGLRALPRTTRTAQEKPITIGVGEPFITTITVCAYFALLFTLPLLLYQGYAFVIPALNSQERRIAVPLMVVAPLLFAAGVAFAYVFVLPPAVHFLQGYNSGNFDILVQAKTYYAFQVFTMLAIGLAFQLPLGLLGLQRLGVINSTTLTRHWRYAVVIIAVIAAAMPAADPVTTALEALPLLILYVASIVLLKIADRRAAARAAAELAQMGDSLDLT